jgi:hypothetical protein
LPFLFRVSPQSPDAERKNRAADILQFMAALAVMADFIGALGLYQLYQIGIPYGYILHFSVPLFATIMLSMFINQRYAVRPVYSIVWAFLIIILCGIIWEGIENFADHFFGTHLAGPDQSTATNVSVLDVYVDAAGAAIGAGIMLIRSRAKKSANANKIN